MSRAKSSTRMIVAMSAALSPGVVLMVACGSPDAGADAAAGSDATVFEGARLIVGDGSAPIEDAVFVVDNERFTQAGRRGDVQVPEGATRVDLSGKTVMPAIVNAHMHLSTTREERVDQLQHMAFYGAGVVVSLGHDDGSVPFEMRDESVPDGARSRTAGRGITGLEPGRTEVPYRVTSEEEARTAVQELAALEVDMVKIWVDDRKRQLREALPGPVRSDHRRGPHARPPRPRRTCFR